MSTVIIESRLSTIKTGVCVKGVLYGVVACLALQAALSVLGVAVGSGAVNPIQDQEPFKGLTWAASWWWIVSGLVSLAVGGYVAVASTEKRETAADGELSGFLVWCLVNVIGAYFVAAAGVGIVKGVGTAAREGKNFVGSVINTTGVRSKIDQLLRQSPRIENGAQASLVDMQDLLVRVFNPEGREVDPVDKQALIDTLANRTNMAREQVTNEVNNLETSFNQMKERFKAEAATKADEARRAARKAAIAIFAVLCLGALAAILGGRLAVHVEDKLSNRTGTERSAS